jgi:hypothetical protein
MLKVLGSLDKKGKMGVESFHKQRWHLLPPLFLSNESGAGYNQLKAGWASSNKEA